MMLDFLCAICVAGRGEGGGGDTLHTLSDIVRNEKLSGGYSVYIVVFLSEINRVHDLWRDIQSAAIPHLQGSQPAEFCSLCLADMLLARKTSSK